MKARINLNSNKIALHNKVSLLIVAVEVGQITLSWQLYLFGIGYQGKHKRRHAPELA